MPNPGQVSEATAFLAKKYNESKKEQNAKARNMYSGLFLPQQQPEPAEAPKQPMLSDKHPIDIHLRNKVLGNAEESTSHKSKISSSVKNASS